MSARTGVRFTKFNALLEEGMIVCVARAASFSRALRRLEKKGLIERHNYATTARYSTHAWLALRARHLTEEGERLTLTNIVEKLTSISNNGTVSIKEGA